MLETYLENLSSGIENFLSTEKGAWKGESGEHIASLCTAEIKPIIDKLKVEASHLSSAKLLISTINEKTKDIDDNTKKLNSLNFDSKDYGSMKSYYNSLITSARSDLNDAINKIRTLLS